MKNKVIVSIIVFILLIILGCYSHIFINLWCIITENGYFIPQESNILVFNATKMNSGSGGWWLYGEDNKYYYALNPFGGYLKLQKGNEPSDFDKFNYETWRIKIPFTDTRDGKVYKTVKIGEQVWMAENLNYEAEGSKCYNDSTAYCKKYGRLYDWKTAMKVCPSGWHLPSIEEWDILFYYADTTSGANSPYNSKMAGKLLKTTSGWNDYKGKSGNGTDDFGFSALPGGYSFSGSGFAYVGYIGSLWSSCEDISDICSFIVIDDDDETGLGVNGEKYLNSVRCLQD